VSAPPITAATTTGAAPAKPTEERARLREAAEAFESILIRQMLQRMREAQLEKGFFGESTGASTYEGIFAERLSGQLAQGSPLGIADLLEAQWLERTAEGELPEPPTDPALELQAVDAGGSPQIPAESPKVPTPGADKIDAGLQQAAPADEENHEDS